jgi:hypothetical protein
MSLLSIAMERRLEFLFEVEIVLIWRGPIMWPWWVEGGAIGAR